jgi:hypothetical protein
MAVHGPEAELGQASEQRQRPAALVGDVGHTLLTRHFEAPRLLVVRGCAPPWQSCHVDDLASALELAAVGVVRGDLTVGCDRVALPGRGRVAQRPQVARAPRPADVQHRPAAAPPRRDPVTVGSIAYVVYPWAVECAALHAAG